MKHHVRFLTLVQSATISTSGDGFEAWLSVHASGFWLEGSHWVISSKAEEAKARVQRFSRVAAGCDRRGAACPSLASSNVSQFSVSRGGDQMGGGPLDKETFYEVQD